ncbi:TauD/TfdA family dioxygenase [Sulfitobacter sp. HNIBRBA2951]|uniref:TauD/TfdA family dioxygenase n=1 Tax=Sulfitobacter aquimarinus TaxID=3158557 RepID=UPI0032DFDBA5
MSIIRLSAASATPDTVRHALHTAGFCVINYGDVGSVAQAQALTLDLARDIGTPMAHDKRGALLWDIRAQSGGTTEGRTFSEHSDEAALHTDSQYRNTPEDAFCLYCIKPAACGGGRSFVLTLGDLLLDLAQAGVGDDMIAALQNHDFPFAVPHVFETENDKFTFGPVVGADNTIRYRKDALEKGMQAHGARGPQTRGFRSVIQGQTARCGLLEGHALSGRHLSHRLCL